MLVDISFDEVLMSNLQGESHLPDTFFFPQFKVLTTDMIRIK